MSIVGTNYQDFSTTQTPTLSNVNSSASVVNLLAANTARKGVTVFNDSTSACYIKYGSAASTTSFTVKVAAGGYWEAPQPVPTVILTIIWDAANGAARVTELT